MITRPIRQIAYFVKDIEASARAHSREFGSGPYFIAHHIPLINVLYRGQLTSLDHSSAYGQWGDLMVEFVQQNDALPSAFHDMYPKHSGRCGMHHVALIVDDLLAARLHFKECGFDEAMYAEMNDGFVFVMVDTQSHYGHMIELYERAESLTGFYAMVKNAALNFDGTHAIRHIHFD